jgi:chemotaxis protein MotB
MRKLVLNALGIFMVAAGIISCVPQRKYAELEASKNQTQQDYADLQKKADALTAENKEKTTTLETQGKQLNKLTEDTTTYGREYRRLRQMYDKVNDLNNELLNKNAMLLSNSQAENKKLLQDLQTAQDKLQAKEDSLFKLEKSVKEKQLALEQAQGALKEREARIQELDSLLKAQKTASQLLREKLEEALYNFRNMGISVREENGKVYVSMEAQLLFASGKTEVNKDGKEALIQLAKIIQSEKDLNIIVEGHTDTDRINSGGAIPRDNWELSVLRATEVIKIMTSNSSLDPRQLSAAGRGEYHPVDSFDKSKNRRIEIILEPNLKELYQIID